MIELDENALICDFAETYHIYDYRSLPVKLAATLSAGLGENSRIRRKASGTAVSQEILLLATIADRIELFRYGFSADANKGRNRPISIADSLLEDNRKVRAHGFRTSEEFDAWLAKIRGE